MKISVITLFPEVFKPLIKTSILDKAQSKRKLKVELVDLRNFGLGKHKEVDDRVYGGGIGMVLRVDVLDAAIKKTKSRLRRSKIVLLTPQGETLNQEKMKELSKERHLILVCGKYEGVDERVRELVDEELSIGDYVLSGGEVPAMVVLDSITRLLPGVLESEATQQESFSQNLLEPPQFTRPEKYKGMEVPKVLLSGNHNEIEKWRRKEAIKKTKKRRPDILRKR